MTGKFCREEKNNGMKLGSVKPVHTHEGLSLVSHFTSEGPNAQGDEVTL